MHTLFITILAILLFLIPNEAFAWGPGVHIHISDWVLSNLALFPPSLAEILKNHRMAFFYGSLSADFFVGKGCKTKANHSHNWETGFNIFHKATSPHLQAYAYGYLSHLAADTVAHNFYVPSVMRSMPTQGKFTHVYVEMLADRMVSWDTRIPKKLFAQDTASPDMILRETTNARKVSFYLKKQMFCKSVFLCSSRHWQSSLTKLALTPPTQTERTLFLQMLATAQSLVADTLLHGENSPATNIDPIGTLALQRVKRSDNQR